MARDIIITAGIRFDPKDVDTRAIKDAVVKSLANTELRIAKVKFGNEARAALQDSFSKIQFNIARASIAASARSQLQENFGRIEFVIQRARFGASAINNLKSSFQNLQVTVGQAKLSAAAQKSVQSAASTGPAASNAVTTTQAAAQAAGDAATKFKLQNEALKGVLQNTTAADRATRNYLQSLITTAGSAETFGVKIGQITTRFAAYLVALRAIFAVQQAFSASLRFIFEFDSALQDLQKVIRETPEGLERLSQELFQIADRTGKSVVGVAASFNEFIRSGLGAEEALKRTEAAMIGVNVTGLELSESTKLITSALTVFKDELTDGIRVIDLLTIADERAAASSAEIARGILRSGAAAESVGVSFKELNALTAATIEATQLSGSTIGAALKTIFANLAGNEQKLRAQANAFGANIQAGDSFFVTLEKLSNIFPRLGSEQVAVLNQLLAGKRRFTELTGLLGNFNKVNEILVAEQNAAGVALQRNQIELQKLSAQAQLAVNTFQELIANLTGLGRGEEGIGSIRDLLKATLGTIRDIGDGLNVLIEGIRNTGIAGLELSSVFKTIIKAGIFTFGIDVIKGILIGFKNFITASNTLTVSLNQNTQAIQGQATAILNLNSAQQQTLKTEQQRLRLNEQIASLQVKAATAASRVGAQGGGAAPTGNIITGTLTREISGAARVAVGLALASAVQVLGDASIRLSKEFDQMAGFGSKVAGAFTEAASKGAELGTTFGFMLGPARGLVIGLATAGVSLLSFSLKAEESSNRFLRAIEQAAGKTIRLADAQALFGERFGRSALQAISGLDKVGDVTVGFAVSLERAFALQAAASDNITDQAAKLAKSLEEVRGSVLGTIRASEIQKEIAQFTESFRERAGELQLKIRTGDLGAEFAPVTKTVADIEASLERFISPIETAKDLFEGLSRANVVFNEVISGSTEETQKILQNAGLISERLGEVITKQQQLRALADQSNREFQEAFQDRIKLRDTIDDQIESLEKIITQGKTEKQNADAIAESERQLADLVAKRESLDKAVTSAKNSQKSIDEEIVKLEQEAANIAEEDLKTIIKIAQTNDKIAQETELITLGLQAQTRAFADQLKISEQQAAKRNEILRATLRGGSLAQRAAIEERNARLDAENSVATLREERQRRIVSLVEREEAARAASNNKELVRLQKLRQEFEKASDERITQVEQDFNIKIKTVLDENAFRNIQQVEESLLQFRLSAIQQVIDREEDATRRRIDLIRRLAETGSGRRFIKDEFDPRQQAQREFGLVGAIIIDQLEGATDTAVKGMVAQLNQLGKSGKDAFEILARAQETSLEVLQLAEEETTQKREIILENLKTSSERVAQAEKDLVESRNRIPQLNVQVIESEKGLASANANVETATNSLMKSYQDAADAQFRLNAEVAIAEFRAKQTVGAFRGASEQISFLQDSFKQLTLEISASATVILDIRRQILQEELNIIQSQFNTVRSLAVEAATGGPEVANRLSQQVAVAQAISRGENIGQFPPELLQGIERLFGVIDGLETAVTEQGLASLGLSTDTLDAISVNIIELNRSIAETNKSQVDQAIEQVRLAQEAVLKADEQKSIAQEQLILSRTNRDAAVRAAAISAENLSAVRFGFRENANVALRSLERLEDVRTTIADSQAAILGIQKDALNQITELKSLSEKQLAAFNNLGRIATTGGSTIGTAAGGTLTSMEFFGLLNAAKKEKRAMPAGSNLMLANTSEVVLTRRQSKMLGITPRAIPNAQDGNASFEGVTSAASALTAASNALLNKLNQPGFVQQNITVQLDQNRRLEVRGLEGIESAVRNAFEERVRNLSTKEEQQAISDIVQSIVSRLNEQGIVNTQGF